MTQHARFAPSASSRWLSCTASLTVDVSHLRERSHPSADKGNYLHALAESQLTGGPAPDPPRGMDLTPEDLASAQLYVDLVNAREGEKLVELYTIWVPECGGTTDCAVLDGGACEIIDYKSGVGPVSPVENTQLIIYALGVRRVLAPLYGDFKKFKLTIVQPAIENVKSWTLTNRQLDRWADEILDVIVKVKRGEVEFVPSESNCKWCPAKSCCPALEKIADQVAMEEFRDDARGDSPLTLTEKLDRIPLLRELISAWEAEAMATLQDGDEVPGYKLVEGRKGNRQWLSTPAVEKKLRQLDVPTGLTHEEPKLKGPAPVEKALKQLDLERDWIDGLVTRADGKPKIVRSDDGRDGTDKTKKAKKDFADEEGE